MSKEIAKKETTAIAPVIDYGEYAGEGFESVESSDIKIPMLKLVQKDSPQVEELGAKAGQIYNSVTGEIADSVTVIPALKEKIYVQWSPYGEGSGAPIAQHDPKSEFVVNAIAKNGGNKFGKIPCGDGQYLSETEYVYVVVCDGEESKGIAYLMFDSSKHKPCKNWWSQLYMLLDDNKKRPPPFATRAVVSGTPEKKDKFNYHNFLIKPLGGNWKKSLLEPSSALFQEALAFRDVIKSGRTTVDLSAQRETEDVPF